MARQRRGHTGAKGLVVLAAGLAVALAVSMVPGRSARATAPVCGGASVRFSSDFQWMIGSASYSDLDGDPESGSAYGWIVNGQPGGHGAVGELLFLSFDGDADGAGGESPQSNDGLAFAPAQWGQALALSPGGHLAFARQGNLDLAEGTVSLWVALREDGTSATYSDRSHRLLRYAETDGDTWSVSQSDNGTLYAGGTVGGQWQSAYDSNHGSMKGWRAGEWHHLAFTYSAAGGFMRFYVDGVLAGDTNEGSYDVPGGGSDVFTVGGDIWGNEAAYLLDSVQILDHAVDEEIVRALASTPPAPFEALLPTASLQVGDAVVFSFTPSDGLETGLPCESASMPYPGIPVVNPQPPSTILPPGADHLSLSVDTVTPTEVRFAVGAPLPFDQMTPFDQGAGTTSHTTVVGGIDPNPNVVTHVTVRCAAYPDFLLDLRYRALSEVTPSFPRTGNLWGSSDYCPDDLAGCARVDLWLGAHFSPDQIRALREQNPGVRVLTSINTIENRDLPDDYYLQDIHGNRIETWPGSFRLNVTKPYVAEYQARYAAQKILDGDLMFDGCFFDNFMTTQSYWDHDIYGDPFDWDYNEDGVRDDPDDLDAAWRQGVFHEMDTFLALMPNALVCGHSMHLDEAGVAERFHGISIGFMTADVLQGERSFDELWDRYHGWNTLARAPHITMIESSPPDQIAYGYDYSPWDKIPEATLEFARTYYPSVRFGLTLTLMDDGFFAHEFGDTWHGNRWWYDELNFDLGQPQGSAVEVPLGQAQPAEMLQNGGFEAPIEGAWRFWVDTGSGCAGTLEQDNTDAQEGSASAHVTVPAACAKAWHVELVQDLPPLTADQPYTLRFWARSDRSRTLEVLVQQNQDPWTNYGLGKTVSLGTGWTEHEVHFVATETTDQALLEILLAAEAGPVWLDDVRLAERPAYVLRRDFTRGVVLLNPLAHAQVVDLEDGLRRLLGAQAPREERILDDADDGVAFSGAWQAQTLDSGEWKASGPFFHDWGPGCHVTTEAGAEASFPLAIREADTYHLAAWWPAAPEADSWSGQVTAELLADGVVLAATTLDQRTGGDQWHELPAVDLDPAQENQVRLRCDGSGPCVADAFHLWSQARYNDGEPVSQVRLGPKDGVVLARIDVVGMPDGGLGDGGLGDGGADAPDAGVGPGDHSGCGCQASPGDTGIPLSPLAALVAWLLLLGLARRSRQEAIMRRTGTTSEMPHALHARAPEGRRRGGVGGVTAAAALGLALAACGPTVPTVPAVPKGARGRHDLAYTARHELRVLGPARQGGPLRVDQISTVTRVPLATWFTHRSRITVTDPWYSRLVRLRAYRNGRPVYPGHVQEAPIHLANVFLHRNRARQVFLPGLAVGDALAVVTRRRYADVWFLPPLVVPNQDFVQSFAVTVHHPSSLRVRFRWWARDGAAKPAVTRGGDGDQRWTRVRLGRQDRIPDRPFDPYNGWRALIWVRLERDGAPLPAFTPQGFVARLRRAYAARMALPPPARRLVTQLLARAGRSPAARARALYDFVRTRIRYIADERDMGAIIPRPAAEVLTTRWGDCKDKAGLLVALGRSAGLDLDPVLVAARPMPHLPGLIHVGLFNHVAVVLHTPTGPRYLDPTAAHTPFGRLPSGDEERVALVLSPNSKGLFRLPAPRALPALSGTLTVAPDHPRRASGTLVLRGRLRDGVAAWRAHPTWIPWRRRVARLLSAILPALDVVTLRRLRGSDQSLAVAVTARLDRWVIPAGDRLYVRRSPRLPCPSRIQERARDTGPLLLPSRLGVDLRLRFPKARFRLVAGPHRRAGAPRVAAFDSWVRADGDAVELGVRITRHRRNLAGDAKRTYLRYCRRAQAAARDHVILGARPHPARPHPASHRAGTGAPGAAGAAGPPPPPADRAQGGQTP